VDLASDISALVKKIEARDGSAISESFRTGLTAVLQELVDGSEDLTGALLNSADGHAWAEVLPSGFDKRRFAAMSSALLALSDTTVREARKGQTTNVILEGSEGNIYLMHAGSNMSLTVFTGVKPNLGMTLAQTRRAAERVSSLAREMAAQLAG